MNKSFTQLMETYLNLRDQVKYEEKLGDSSEYWTDTYGFGQSKLHTKFAAAKKELDDYMNYIQKAAKAFDMMFSVY